MNIGIIGTGKIASGLGERWAKAGHQVFFGSRDPQKGRDVAARIGADASGGSQTEAVAFADVLTLAVPWSAVEATLKGLGPLNGKILIETTNNFADPNPPPTTVQITQWAPGAKVVKAFNTVFSDILHGDPGAAPERGSVFMVGDDADAKKIVGQLIHDAGFDPVDAGSSQNVHFLDTMVQFIATLAHAQGMGRHITYRIVEV